MPHRLFFAILPPPRLWPAIGAHGHVCGERRVANGRLHITLAITPDRPAFSEAETRCLRDFAQALAAPPVAIALAKISAWGDALVLRPARTIPLLRDLQKMLAGGMARRGLMREDWTFNPHLTLTYNYQGVSFAGKIEPISWECREFVLIDSHVGLSHYDILGRWPLVPVQGVLF